MLEQGEILRGRYKVIKRLGQGGMGAVYEAHDNVFDTSVALKEVTIDLSNALDTQAQEMTKLAFEREAKILAKISHETIPHVKDYFIEKDAQFLIMELVDGDDLAKLLKMQNGAFPVSTVVEWTMQLLDALDYLHKQDPPIIHRDIKPQNLKLTSRNKIKLLDFGIAKGTESTNANTVTNQTFIAATLNYSPIEQMVRVLDPTFLAVITHKYSDQIERILEQNADFRTDIFALGATLYHMATNKQPAEAIKRGIDIWDGKPDPLENPRALNPELPQEFSDFLLKSMQINRDHRFATAEEMKNALEQISEVITKQSLTPTVEMNMGDIQTLNEQTDSLPPITNQDATVQLPAHKLPSNPSAEIPTEVSKPSPPKKQQIPVQQQTPQTQQIQQQQNNQSQPKQFSTAQTSPDQEPKKKRSKLLWLIPIAGLLMFMFVGGALAVWLVVNNMSDTPVANTNTSSENDNKNTSTNKEVTDTKFPVTKETPDDSNTNSENDNTEVEPSPETTKITITTTQPTRKPTVKPTRKPTVRPTKKPVVRPTRKPTIRPTRPKVRKTPKPKDMNCIYTDSCE